ncbi:MAG TPA: hypothetical protein VIY52_07725 [Streptosporangiaceae bacterium]
MLSRQLPGITVTIVPSSTAAESTAISRLVSPSNDLDPFSLVCSALPGRTVTG